MKQQSAATKDLSACPGSSCTGYRYLDYAYAAAHPAQYAEWAIPAQGNVTADAEEAAGVRRTQDLLLGVLDRLYVAGTYDPQSVLMTPSGRASILHHVPVAERSQVASELARWQSAYLRGVGPSTAEGLWLSRRPLTVRIDDLVFVHGGVHPTATPDELDDINAAVARSLLPEVDLAALGQLLQQHPEIRELVEDRRLHKSCGRVGLALASLNATRIAVGSSHGPRRVANANGRPHTDNTAHHAKLAMRLYLIRALSCPPSRRPYTRLFRTVCVRRRSACSGRIALPLVPCVRELLLL
jgi:hypothetical protein